MATGRSSKTGRKRSVGGTRKKLSSAKTKKILTDAKKAAFLKKAKKELAASQRAKLRLRAKIDAGREAAKVTVKKAELNVRDPTDRAMKHRKDAETLFDQGERLEKRGKEMGSEVSKRIGKRYKKEAAMSHAEFEAISRRMTTMVYLALENAKNKLSYVEGLEADMKELVAWQEKTRKRIREVERG